MSRFSLDIFDTLLLLFSWYVKPILYKYSLYTSLQFSVIFVIVTSVKLLLTIYTSLLYPVLYCFSTIKATSLCSIFLAIKFIALISLLIFVRGGIPRYRYDFLTKLGWIKTLSLVLAVFLINLLISYL